VEEAWPGRGRGLSPGRTPIRGSWERKWIPVFQEIQRAIREDPMLLLGAAFILAIFGYALAKRLLKLALFAAVFFVIYLGLLRMFGMPLPDPPF